MKNSIYSKNIGVYMLKPKKCEIFTVEGITYVGISSNIKEYLTHLSNSNLEQPYTLTVSDRFIEYDAFSIKEDILLRFIKLGELLDSYGIVDKFYNDISRTWMFECLEDFKDNSFTYFTNTQDKELIDNSILDFVNDFGFLGVNNIQSYFWSDSSFEAIDNFSLSRFAEPITLIVNDICNFYAFLKQPNPDYSMDFHINVSLLCNQNKAWKSEYRFDSLWHLIRYSLVTTLTKDGDGLKQCPQCKSWFIPSNPKAEYCSASCRNKFNVYKSRKTKSEKMNKKDI